jgi:hypothetical protein
MPIGTGGNFLTARSTAAEIFGIRSIATFPKNFSVK